MERLIEDSFYSGQKEPTYIRADLIRQLGRIGVESEIGFYDVNGLGSMRSRMCIKEIHSEIIEQHPECGVNKVLEKYLFFKNIGLPVIPILMCDKKKRILMTDLTGDGRYDLIDSHPYKLSPDFEIRNLGLIKRSAYECADTASQYGGFLYQDAYSIVVDKQTHLGKLQLGSDFGMKTTINYEDSCSQEELFDQVGYFFDLIESWIKH